MSEFTYSRWRHGGWYVDNVHYPSGAVGCVSRNYPDGKWRIACDSRDGDFTYRTRDEAAWAERCLIAEAEIRDLRAHVPEIKEALEGDSNDAEHDALAGVADALGIEWEASW